MEEDKFEAELNKIKSSKPKVHKKYVTQKQGENKMKKIKNINWKKIIETIKTIVIYTAIVAGIAFYAGVKFGENNAKAQNAKIAEIVRNLNQNK